MICLFCKNLHAIARGLCSRCYTHHKAKGTLEQYKTTGRHKRPFKSTRRKIGTGTIASGYRMIVINGIKKFEHIRIVEEALGKSLPLKAQVHHIDGNRLNNKHNNLVVCPDDAYHQLLHRRQRAFEKSGHADWVKCPHCQKYDDPKNMYVPKRKWQYPRHRLCTNEYNRKYYKIRNRS